MEVQRHVQKDEDIESNNVEINLDYERDIFKRLNQHIEPMKNPMMELTPASTSAAAIPTLPPPPPSPSQRPPSQRPPSLPSQQQPPPPSLSPAIIPRKESLHQPQPKVQCTNCDEEECLECPECSPSPSSKCVCDPYPCKKTNKEEINWKILTLRVCIAFVLCSLASGLGAAAFLLLRNIELNTFQAQFNSATNQIQTTVTTALKAKFVANSLVQNIFRYGIPTGKS